MQAQTQLTREAWRTYATTGRLRHDLLRPEIYRSWQRCHLDHVSPRQFRPKTLGKNDTDRVCASHRALIQAAAPYLSALSRAAGDASHAALLGASDGTLIDLRGDEETISGQDAMPPVGTLMSESAAGSNGIGTAIVDQKYVELYGPEHFISGFHEHLCLGLPLRNGANDISGALCLSVRSAQTAAHLRGLFFAVARGIESELRAESMRERLAQLLQSDAPNAQSMTYLHDEVRSTQIQARRHMATGVETLARGEPSEHIHHARDHLEQFLRASRTWQLVSGLPVSPPMSTGELAANVVEVLQSEAKLLRVSLVFLESWESGVAVTPPFARLLLSETSQALRAVGPHGSVSLRFSHDGSLSLRSQTEDESLCIERRLPGRMAA